MKKYVTLFALTFLIVFAGTAQRHNLKGPAAKNYKPWKSPKNNKEILVSQRKEVKGPEAKNYKPWKNPAPTTKLIVIERRDIKGPVAKNSRPFERTSNQNTMLADAKDPKEDK